jgi:hypothetical protein
MAMSANEATVKRLKAMRKQSQSVRALFDFLLIYDNTEHVTVKPVALGSGLSEKEVRDVFGSLQRLKLGRIKLGRHGKDTRFEWAAADWKKNIPAKQRGEPEDEDEVEMLAGMDNSNATHLQVGVWSLKLGGRRTATLILPRGVDSKDLEMVARFCARYQKLLGS